MLEGQYNTQIVFQKAQIKRIGILKQKLYLCQSFWLVWRIWKEMKRWRHETEMENVRLNLTSTLKTESRCFVCF